MAKPCRHFSTNYVEKGGNCSEMNVIIIAIAAIATITGLIYAS